MRRSWCFIIIFCLVAPAFLPGHAEAGVYKWIQIGKYQTRIVDSGDQGESAGEGTFAYYYYTDFTYAQIDQAGWMLGCKNWTDVNGNLIPVKIAGAGHGSADENVDTIPIPDADGTTIRTFRRYSLPNITVDGVGIDPYLFTGAYGYKVDPDYIDQWGRTADIMVESKINTSMGITINQRCFAWSQRNHDDYIIFDWTLTNTGNIDLDDDIELNGQTIQDLYFWRAGSISPSLKLRMGRLHSRNLSS